MRGLPPGYNPREEGAGVGPYAAATRGSTPAAASAARSQGEKSSGQDAEGMGEDGGSKDDNIEADIVPGAVTARLKTYIKPRIPSTQDVLDRRSRKNAQSRARASKLRLRIGDIEKKKESVRTEEEQQIFNQYEARRQRKNNRSRERALEKKEEIDRILAKSEKKRTKIEIAFLDNALSAKKRKNEGDRLRRQRLKELGLSTKGSGVKPGISARGPLPQKYHPHHPHHMPHPYGHVGEIPMSPMPPMAGHHMQSPGGFVSPGMMPGMGYPSPQPGRRPGTAGPGAMETPGRAGAGQGGASLPYIPPAQAYDAQSPQNNQHAFSQHQHAGSRVEHRRHPDGSMSISIGGGSGANGTQGSEDQPPSMNMTDVSHLLLYDNAEECIEQQQSQDA